MRLNGILAGTLLAAAIPLLGAGVGRALEPETQPRTLTPETAHRICEEVLALANSGELESRLIDVSRGMTLDYDGDGIGNRLKIEESLGTCPARDLVDWDRRNPDGSLDLSHEGFTSREIEKDEALRWAHVGGKDYFLFVDGEPVVVAARFWQIHAFPKALYWFGNGRRRPLCAFQFTGQITDHTVAGPDRAICDAIARRNFLSPSLGTESPGLRLRNPDGSESDFVDGLREFAADLDHDGTAERLGHARQELSGGCGMSNEFLLELLSDGVTRASSAVATALADFDWRDLNRNRTDPASTLPLVALQGDQAYILARSPFGSVGAYTIRSGQPRLHCEFDRIPQFTILQEYPTAP